MTESQVMRRGFALIFAVWLIALLGLAIGTVSKSPISFLWPMGQDIDWSLILKQGIGAKAAEQEFSFDHRTRFQAGLIVRPRRSSLGTNMDFTWSGYCHA
jgi:hypothetical protein